MSLAIFLIAFFIWILVSIHYGTYRMALLNERRADNATNVTSFVNETGNATDYLELDNSTLQDSF